LQFEPAKTLFGDVAVQAMLGVFDLAPTLMATNLPRKGFSVPIKEGGKPVDAENQSMWNLSSGWISASILGGSGLI